MPDYPDAIRQAAYAARYGEPVDTYTWERVADAVLDAVAEDLGEHAAAKIIRHRDEHQPGPGSARLFLAWRRHFQVAAQVARRAFLTDEDLKRMAAEALAAGQFAWCPSPEDGDGG